MTELTLIEKLEAHLNHIRDMLVGNANNTHNSGERFNAIYDELKLILALIEGSKEK